MPSTQPQRPYNVRYYWSHRAEEIERVTRRQRATVEWLRDMLRYAPAWGRNKKDAEQRAAMNALSQLAGEAVPFESD